MPTFHRGSWFGLPDLGITEMFTQKRTPQGGSDIFSNSPPQQPQQPAIGQGSWGMSPNTNLLPINNQGGGSGRVLGTPASRSMIPSSGAQITQNPFQGLYSAAMQSRDMNISMINDEFNREMGRLGGLEEQVKSRYQSAIQQAQEMYPQFQELLQRERQADLDAITSQEDQSRLESQRGLARTRQMLNDLQRAQAARMSATGNYSSSVADAFGEFFGRKAFEANSRIQEARDQALRSLAQERNRVENFYARKSIEAKQAYDNLLSSLQQQLQNQLDQIANAKNAASSAKAQATAEAWNTYTQNKINLDMSLLQYMNTLDEWRALQEQTYKEAVEMRPDDILSQFRPRMLGDASLSIPQTRQPATQTEQALILANRRRPYLEDILG